MMQDGPAIPTLVLLAQLGTPRSPRIQHIRLFLRQFLTDPRVIDEAPFYWKVILYLFILPWRPRQLLKNYRLIWQNGQFPLVANTEAFVQKVQQCLPRGLPMGRSGSEITVRSAYLIPSLGQPSVQEVLQQWQQQHKGEYFLLYIPQFPQYCEATTASAADVLFKQLHQQTYIPNFKFIGHHHRQLFFISASVQQVEKFLQQRKCDGDIPDALVLSFHGVPVRRIVDKQDPYVQHCLETFYNICQNLKEIAPEKIYLSFQSRFGQEEWTRPGTEELCRQLVLAKNKKNIFVYCPSFVVDCLETSVEIGHELQQSLHATGARISAIPCLNSSMEYAGGMAQWIQQEQQDLCKSVGQPPLITPEFLTFKEQYMQKMQKQAQAQTLGPQERSTFKIIFLILFLDLVGFTLIFPMFPAMAKYYTQVDANNFFLRHLMQGISTVTSWGGQGGSFSPLVLFGGVLGALYSLLQFIFAPFWGALSDRIGRRPVLLISVAGLGLSYLLWGLAGSFTMLIFARFLGGIMSGNIATATAVVADITSRENRSKGMAIIGIAFALGFIIGPALGGILSLLDLTQVFPAWEAYGVNPFSTPAFLAFILSVFNLIFLYLKFNESLPEHKRRHQKDKSAPATERSANPLTLFRPLPFPGVNATNWGYFLFLVVFSGMEFTLTFLAVERLSYTSMDNGIMFIFIGVTIALIQGGFVRRKAAQLGEKKLATWGMLAILPGLLIVSQSYSSVLLYCGLFFLAVGSAMVIPCLTALASLYAPAQEQGRVMGLFRSLGALARVIGPLSASIVYWRWGSSFPYLLGAFLLLVPVMMVGKLPPVQKEVGEF